MALVAAAAVQAQPQAATHLPAQHNKRLGGNNRRFLPPRVKRLRHVLKLQARPGGSVLESALGRNVLLPRGSSDELVMFAMNYLLK